MQMVITLSVFHLQTRGLYSAIPACNRMKVAVGSQTTVNSQLQSSNVSLGEVVVIGYGTTRKSDLTGSVATVKSERLLDRPVTDVSQALQGKVPGVDVSVNTSAPGESAKIRIRGTSSINSGLDPLFVVDGVIGVDATSLNPNDIASVEVLKDASSTAIYGARGANGVIIITTKRGIKGRSRISYDTYVSQNTLQRHLRALDANEFMQVYNLAYKNAQKYDSAGFAEQKYVPNNPLDFPNLFDRGDASINNWMTNYWQSENYLTYNKKVTGNQRLTALLGLSWQKTTTEYVGASTSNFIDDYWQWHNLGAGTGQPGAGSYDDRSAMNSYFARLTYNISDKYLLTATGRYDGSSRFGINNK